MARKSRERQENSGASPAPASMMTSKKAMFMLGVIFIVVGVFSALGQMWIEAVMWMALGVVMMGASFPIFGRGRMQTWMGVGLTVVAVVMFLALIVRDLAS
jgi:hypothetical protein